MSENNNTETKTEKKIPANKILVDFFDNIKNNEELLECGAGMSEETVIELMKLTHRQFEQFLNVYSIDDPLRVFERIWEANLKCFLQADSIRTYKDVVGMFKIEMEPTS